MLFDLAMKKLRYDDGLTVEQLWVTMAKYDQILLICPHFSAGRLRLTARYKDPGDHPDFTPRKMSSPTYSADTFKPLLAKLVKHPATFTPDDTKLAFEHLLKPDSITPAQIGAFLTALHISGVDQLPGTLAAAAGVLKEHCIRPTVEGYDDGEFVVDIVGTGGDGHDTFNVSTAAAIIAAGAGARVCKVSNQGLQDFRNQNLI